MRDVSKRAPVTGSRGSNRHLGVRILESVRDDARVAQGRGRGGPCVVLATQFRIRGDAFAYDRVLFPALSRSSERRQKVRGRKFGGTRGGARGRECFILESPRRESPILHPTSA